MKKTQCDIFISYRRDGGDNFAGRLRNQLTEMGYIVFLDVESLNSGPFNHTVYENIKACMDFLLVLQPHALDRCTMDNDLMRKEIEYAFLYNKNIIPIFIDNFQWPNPSEMPENLRKLTDLQKITVTHELFKQSVYMLQKKFLTSKKRVKYASKIKNVFIVLLFSVLLAETFAMYIKYYHKTIETKAIWNGKVAEGYAGGTGSKEKPYKIDNAEQLAMLAYIVNEGFCYADTYFELGNDIYLNDPDKDSCIHISLSNESYMIKENYLPWTAIGTEDAPFSGHFDGKGHTVYGLYINTQDKNYQGLFGCCSETSVLSNIRIDESKVICENGQYISLLVGKSSGLIDSCFVCLDSSTHQNYLCGGSFVGGIAGDGNIIFNCGSSVHIKSWYGMEIYSSDSSIELDYHTYIENCLFGGIAGRCNYIVNSVSHAVIGIPGYISGALVGEVKYDMYNCVCDHAVTGSDYPFGDYFSYLGENNLAFLYTDNVALFDDLSKSPILDKKMYIVNETQSTWLNVSGFAGSEREMKKLDNEFAKFFPRIPFIVYYNEYLQRHESYQYGIGNHDYNAKTKKYNNITQYMDGWSMNVSDLNKNACWSAIADTDLEEAFWSYQQYQDGLNFMEWDLAEGGNLVLK